MTSANQWRAEQRAKRMVLSELNRATTAAYHRCRMAGGHTPSEQRISRDHGGRLVELRICSACGVPITKASGWMQAMMSARKGRTR